MTVFKRGDIWWYEFQFAGQRYAKSTKSASKMRAIEAERQRRRELEDGYNGLTPRVLPKTLAVAAEDYLQHKTPTVAERTIEIEKANLKHLLPVLGRLLLTDIKAEHLSDYQRSRLQQRAAPKTINLEVGTIRAILRRYGLWARLQVDVRPLRTSEDVGKALTTDEEHRLVSACMKNRSRCLYPIVLLTLQTGLRYSDVRLLRWNQIDFARQRLTVDKSKTKYSSGRVIALNHVAMRALQEWAAQFPLHTEDHYVFPTERYGAARGGCDASAYNTDPTMPIGSFKKSWEASRKTAGVNVRFHDLRHTVCTRLLENGAAFSVVGSIMGWSPATTIRMSKRYGHIGDTSMRAALDGLIPPSQVLPRKAAVRPS